jgi:[acyl-carrier-protein] S-malonyltransferase
MPLNVSAAFHSPLMQAAGQALAQTIAMTPIVNARVPVVANATATIIASNAELQHELVTQVTAPVRWIETITTMQHHGITKIIEIGPGAVLTGLVKRIAPNLERQTINTIEQCTTLDV